MDSKIRQLLEQTEKQKQSAETGESSVASASRDFSEAADAAEIFDGLKRKLFRVRRWNKDSALTSFELFGADGNVCGRENAVVGDFMRLSMPGAGKDDWVKIVEIFDEADEAVVALKPSYNPTEDEPDKTATSHFFTSRSTNNFCLKRNGAAVSFYVIGLSEETNTNETENYIEKARNLAVANIGSYLGIQKSQWKTFCENFLEIGD